MFLPRDAEGFSHYPLDLSVGGTPLSSPRCRKNTTRRCLSELTIRNERHLQIRVRQEACLIILNTSLLRQRPRKGNNKLMEALLFLPPRRPVSNKMEASWLRMLCRVIIRKFPCLLPALQRDLIFNTTNPFRKHRRLLRS